MNGAARTEAGPRNVTIEDDPEPGDPPPRGSSPSPPPAPAPQQPSAPPKDLPQQPQSPLAGPEEDNGESDGEPEYMTPLQYTNSLIRQATMPILPPDMEDFCIPPSPPGSPDRALAQKLENFRQLRQRGVHFNDRLGSNKGFRNPKILERLRGYVGVEDEYGSHLPEKVWNPHGFSEDQYYDKLAEKQKSSFDALQARQLNEPRSSIEFTSSSRPTAPISAAERIMEGLNSRPTSRPVSRTGSDAERKRSRYDDRRDDRQRDHRRDRRDDGRDGHRSRDRSPPGDRYRDRDRDRRDTDRDRGYYRERDHGSRR